MTPQANGSSIFTITVCSTTLDGFNIGTMIHIFVVDLSNDLPFGIRIRFVASFIPSRVCVFARTFSCVCVPVLLFRCLCVWLGAQRQAAVGGGAPGHRGDRFLAPGRGLEVRGRRSATHALTRTCARKTPRFLFFARFFENGSKASYCDPGGGGRYVCVLDELVTMRRATVVCGQPGSGKSVLVKVLAASRNFLDVEKQVSTRPGSRRAGVPAVMAVRAGDYRHEVLLALVFSSSAGSKKLLSVRARMCFVSSLCCL